MIALITALATALVEFLKLRNATIHHDLAEQLEQDIEQLEHQILCLRDSGDDSNERRADELRGRLFRRQGLLANLPAPQSVPTSGGAGTNKGRPIHSSG